MLNFSRFKLLEGSDLWEHETNKKFWDDLVSDFKCLRDMGLKYTYMDGSKEALTLAISNYGSPTKSLPNCCNLVLEEDFLAESNRCSLFAAYHVIVFGVEEQLRCEVIDAIGSVLSQCGEVLYEGVECRAISQNSKNYIIELKVRASKKIDALSTALKAEYPSVQVLIWKGHLNHLRRKLFIIYSDYSIPGLSEFISIEPEVLREFLKSVDSEEIRNDLFNLSEKILSYGYYLMLVYDPRSVYVSRPATWFAQFFESFVPDFLCIVIHVNCQKLSPLRGSIVNWNVNINLDPSISRMNVYNPIDSICDDLFTLIGDFGFEWFQDLPSNVAVLYELEQHDLLHCLANAMRLIIDDGTRGWRVMQTRFTRHAKQLAVNFFATARPVEENEILCEKQRDQTNVELMTRESYCCVLTTLKSNVNWNDLIMIFELISRNIEIVYPYLHVNTLSRPSRASIDAIEMHLIFKTSDVSKLSEELEKMSSSAGFQCTLRHESILRRRTRIAIFDMDSTLISQECIDEMAKICGVGDEVSDITQKSMRGELDFEESLFARLSLFKGMKIDTVFRQVISNLSYTQGVFYMVNVLKKLGVKMAIVSGGFEQIAKVVAQKLSIDRYYSNTLEIDESGYLVGGIEPNTELIDSKMKSSKLLEFAKKDYHSSKYSLAIGDGANDVYMLSEAGLGIAFNAKPYVKRHANYSIDFPNISLLLFILGISWADSTDLIIQQL